MAREMSIALRRGVPLKSMCSMQWAMPLSRGVSAREPTGTQIPTVAERRYGTRSVTMATPLSRRVRATVIDRRCLAASPRSPAPPVAVAVLRRPPFLLGAGGRTRGGLEAPLLLELLVGEADLAVPVHLEDADGDLVPLLEAFRRVHPVLRDLGDVEESVRAREDLDERAELHDLPDASLVHLSHLGLLDDPLDDGDGGARRLLVDRGDLDGPVVLDVDLDACLLLDPPDDLASRADDLADLVGLDHHHVDPRGEGGELGPMLGKGGVHLPQDVEPALPGLPEGGEHDLAADAADLDVHLDGGDAVLRPRNLEVHVPQMVLVAEDVGEDRDVVAL